MARRLEVLGAERQEESDRNYPQYFVTFLGNCQCTARGRAAVLQPDITCAQPRTALREAQIYSRGTQPAPQASQPEGHILSIRGLRLRAVATDSQRTWTITRHAVTPWVII